MDQRRRALARSSPIRIALAIGLALAALGACSSGSSIESGPDSGGPLRLYGGTDNMVLIPGRTYVGEELGFAFPWMHNGGSKPIRIVGFRIGVVPSVFRVEKYELLNSIETHGLGTGSFPVNQNGVEGYDHYRDYLPSHPLIAPGATSHLYGVVYARVMTAGGGDLSGCHVMYRYSGRLYDAQAKCTLRVRRSFPASMDPNPAVR